MKLQTRFLYLAYTLTLTSSVYGSHSDQTKASTPQDIKQHPASSKKSSLGVIGVGLTTTALGYAWYLGTSWAESMICQDRMEPCTGDETYKLQAQALMKAGITVTTVGTILLLHDVLDDQNKK